MKFHKDCISSRGVLEVKECVDTLSLSVCLSLLDDDDGMHRNGNAMYNNFRESGLSLQKQYELWKWKGE